MADQKYTQALCALRNDSKMLAALEKRTLLGNITPEIEREVAASARAEDDAYEILSRMLQAYSHGEYTFQAFCHECDKVLEAQQPLSPGARRKLLGQAVHQALNVRDLPQRHRGNQGQPSWKRRAASELVEVVREREGLSRTRVGNKRSAYVRVSHLLKLKGVAATPREVERWDQDTRKPSRRSQRIK